MCKFLTIPKVFGDAVSGPGRSRAVHRVTENRAGRLLYNGKCSNFPGFQRFSGMLIPVPVLSVRGMRPPLESIANPMGLPSFSAAFLLGDWQDPAGRHGRSSTCPRAPPFAVYRKMLEFPTISRFSGMLFPGPAVSPGGAPPGCWEKL